MRARGRSRENTLKDTRFASARRLRRRTTCCERFRGARCTRTWPANVAVVENATAARGNVELLGAACESFARIPRAPIAAKSGFRGAHGTLLSMRVKTQSHRDAHGRRWQVSLVPVDDAASADFEFWHRMSAEARVRAVFDCTESALKAQGRTHVPRLRRVARRVELGRS